MNEAIRYAKNDVANILAYHYTHLAGKYEIELTLRLEIDRETKITDADLCSLMSNLLENGIEACLRQKDDKRFHFFKGKEQKGLWSGFCENHYGAV